MEFDIALDDPKRVYVPGEKVKGNVVLNARSDVAAGLIRITFIGKSKAKLKMNRAEYESKADLFGFSQILYQANYTFSAAKRFEWPFSFRFPRTPVGPIENSDFTRKGLWQYTCSCPLPPSFDFEDDSLNSTLTCSVVYRLEAELIKPTDSFSLISRKFHCIKPVSFASERVVACPIIFAMESTNLWDINSYRILPEFQSRSLTVKEKMQSVFGSSKLPTSKFRVTTTLPTQIVQNMALPVTLKVDHLPSDSTTDIVPSVHLTEVSLKVTAITTGRGDTTFGRWHNLDTETKFVIASRRDLDYSLFDEAPGKLAPGATASLNLHDILDLKCAIKTPNFLVYNIRRDYRLHLKLVLRSADKHYEMRQNIGRFHIHSSRYSGYTAPPPISEAAYLVPPPPEGGDRDISGLNDPPPAYSKAEDSKDKVISAEHATI